MTRNRIGLTLYYPIYLITVRKGTTSSQIRHEGWILEILSLIH